MKLLPAALASSKRVESSNRVFGWQRLMAMVPKAHTLLVVAVALLATCFSGCEKNADRLADQETVKATAKDSAYLALVLEQLKDPESARFRKLRYSSSVFGEALCGEVNSKNSYGGYVGFNRFVVTQKPLIEGKRVVIASGSGEALQEIADRAAIAVAGCDRTSFGPNGPVVSTRPERPGFAGVSYSATPAQLQGQGFTCTAITEAGLTKTDCRNDHVEGMEFGRPFRGLEVRFEGDVLMQVSANLIRTGLMSDAEARAFIAKMDADHPEYRRIRDDIKEHVITCDWKLPDGTSLRFIRFKGFGKHPDTIRESSFASLSGNSQSWEREAARYDKLNR